MPLGSTQDILNIAASIAIIFIAAVLGIFLIQLILIIRDFRHISKSIHEKLEAVDSILNTIKEKIDHSANYLSILIQLTSRVIDYMKEKKTSQTEEGHEEE